MATKGTVHEDDQEEEFEEEGRGRSKRKRHVQTFDVMALELLELSDDRCKKLPITQALKEGLNQARKTKSKSARRRHIRHLAGLLRDREDETEAIRCYLAGEPYVAIKGDESYRDLDALRESLCAVETFDAAIEDVVEQLPYIDLALVTRIAKSIHDEDSDKERRALFRELRRAADESDIAAEEESS